jgi:hypothetical protein
MRVFWCWPGASDVAFGLGAAWRPCGHKFCVKHCLFGGGIYSKPCLLSPSKFTLVMPVLKVVKVKHNTEWWWTSNRPSCLAQPVCRQLGPWNFVGQSSLRSLQLLSVSLKSLSWGCRVRCKRAFGLLLRRSFNCEVLVPGATKRASGGVRARWSPFTFGVWPPRIKPIWNVVAWQDAPKNA